MSKFWMIYMASGDAPKVRHSDLFDAKKEAERLAKLNPGKEVFVLEATVSAVVPVQRLEWRELEELPF